MLDALLITVAIAGISFSLFYKFLLVLYRSGQRSSQHARKTSRSIHL